ncbi:MAG: sensor histidine kinase, partial [Candidatus Rokuibacteriota bacterium]
MRRLYLRIYLAVLASLVAFALVAGLLSHLAADAGPVGHAFEVAGTLARNALPPATAPPREQQAALERLAANLGADVALFAADRTRLA